MSYSLKVELPVKRYPGLLASVQADMALVKAESERRSRVHTNLVAAIEADTRVKEARQALKVAEAEVQRLEDLCARCETQVEAVVYAQETIKEATDRWDKTAGSLLSVGEMNELVEAANLPRLLDLFFKEEKVAVKP